MRILISLSFYLPNISGLTFCVKHVAEAFAEVGRDVIILTSRHKKSLPEKEVINRVKIERVPVLFTIGKGLFMPLFIIYAFKNVSSADIVFVNLPQLEGFIIALIAKLFRKKLICIYHCEIVFPRNFINTLITYIIDFSHLTSLLCADSIVTYTEDYALHSRLLPKFVKKIRYILPPVPKPKMDKTIQKEFRKYIGEDKFVIGFAARVSKEKGFEYLLNSIPFIERELNKPFIILVAGPKHPIGESDYWDYLQPLIEKYKKHIKFLDAVPFDKLGSFYDLLDVLVLSSINSTEAFGLVQVEAMFYGVPVIASDLPGVRIPVKLTGMGLISKIKDSEDLSEKLAEIYKNKEKYKRPGNFIESIFNYDDSISAYKKLITN